MNIKEWRTQRIKHLGKYKYNELKIQENGIAYKYTETERQPMLEDDGKSPKRLPNILPIELCDDYKWKNIIPSDYQQEIISIIKTKEICLHKEFHHLNSSQALCFNLFFPLRIELGHKYINESSEETKYAFEYVKNPIEKTQIDHYVVYFKPDTEEHGYEVKYTEETPDEKTRERNKKSKDKYKFNKYRQNIRKYFCDENITESEFIYYEQIYRHIIYSYENNILLYYVYPEKRPEWKNIVENKMYKLKEEYKAKENIEFITIDYIVDICKKCNNQKFKRHYELFEKKYLL